MSIQILRLPEVLHRTGLSRSSVYLRIASGQFPRPIALGNGRAVGWIQAEIEQWLQQQLVNSRQCTGKMS